MRATSPTPRLLSLDVFRGFTIAAMVLVNNSGDWAHIYAPLRHAVWHGWTFTDWIFPFFLFICGVSLFPMNPPPNYAGRWPPAHWPN